MLGLLFTSLPLHAEKRNDVRKHRLLSVAERVERCLPDVLPAKSRATGRSRVEQIAMSARKGRVNTKFREGIDVSRYQGEINWTRVAEEGGVSYVYIKATEGANLVDRYYQYNITEARKMGLSVGSYHFYRAHISIEEQLANMTAVVRKEEQDLVPIIDIEVTNGVGQERFIRDLREFVARVTAYYGCKPMLYTYQNFYNKHLVGEFRGYHWMIAKYKSEAPVLEDDVDYIMWQYTQTGRIPGIRGNVDRSCLMGNHSLTSLQM